MKFLITILSFFGVGLIISASLVEWIRTARPEGIQDLEGTSALEEIQSHTYGCIEGPDVKVRKYSEWQTAPAIWAEFRLSESELSCLREKGNVTRCLEGCEKTADVGAEYPDWFKVEGEAYTFHGSWQMPDGFKRQYCLWRSQRGQNYYVFRYYQAASCEQKKEAT